MHTEQANAFREHESRFNKIIVDMNYRMLIRIKARAQYKFSAFIPSWLLLKLVQVEWADYLLSSFCFLIQCRRFLAAE